MTPRRRKVPVGFVCFLRRVSTLPACGERGERYEGLDGLYRIARCNGEARLSALMALYRGERLSVIPYATGVGVLDRGEIDWESTSIPALCG